MHRRPSQAWYMPLNHCSKPGCKQDHLRGWQQHKALLRQGLARGLHLVQAQRASPYPEAPKLSSSCLLCNAWVCISNSAALQGETRRRCQLCVLSGLRLSSAIATTSNSNRGHPRRLAECHCAAGRAPGVAKVTSYRSASAQGMHQALPGTNAT